MAERVPSGIKGLDELIGGGFIRSSSIMVSGKTGSGKTLFSTQFLYDGLLNNEPGVYVTFEERVEDIKKDIEETFGWNFESFEKKNKLLWLPLRVKRIWHPVEKKEVLSMGFYQIVQKILEAVDKIKAKRVVIDSISAIEMMFKDKYMIRSEVVSLVDSLKEKGVTSVFISEVPESDMGMSRLEFLEFVVDTIIKLDFVYIAKQYQRTLTIRKMRRSKHSTLIHPFVIRENGIEVLKV